MTDTIEKTFQYQNCNGDWKDINSSDRDMFLDYCVDNNDSINSHNDAIVAMESGEKLRNDPADWYRNCRMFDKIEDEKRMKEFYRRENERLNSLIYCSDCGQSGHNGQYPFSTIVGDGVCDDCI